MVHRSGPSIDKLEHALNVGLRAYQDMLEPHGLRFYMSEGTRLGVAQHGRFSDNRLIAATAPLTGEYGKMATLEVVVLPPGKGTGRHVSSDPAQESILQAGLESMGAMPVHRPRILGEAVMSFAAIRGEDDIVPHAMRLTKIGMREKEIAAVAELGQPPDTYSRVMDRIIQAEPNVTFTIKEYGKDASSEVNPGLGSPEAFVNMTSDTLLFGIVSIPVATGTWHQEAFNALGAVMPIQPSASIA